VTSDALAAGRQALARHFRARVPALLDAWRAGIAADPQLTASKALPRSQLEDHLPSWLESFAGILAAAPGEPTAERAEARDAEAHGLQRWQQGYDLRDVTREWGWLHRCLVAELEACAATHPSLPAEALVEARMKLAEQVSEAMSASAEKYFRLERVEAAGSLNDLEHALAEVRELERKRAELWQQAAHDLRGNLGVVSNVAHGLTFRELPAERRQDFLALLRNNVTALNHLLDDVTVLARLQAGQEQRRIARFDAADLLRRLADDVRPLADDRGLYLRAAGPDALEVQGDAVKVRRIAQNLLLNALKYTRAGGVTITWGDTAAGDDGRWFFTIADTGPGFHAGPGAPIVSAFNPARAGEPGAFADAADGDEPSAASDDGRPISQAQGEGLGLAIVKRLCDLLDASVEIETEAERGTTVSVFVPSRYPSERG
jgi:signal transduction histidine kinase